MFWRDGGRQRVGAVRQRLVERLRSLADRNRQCVGPLFQRVVEQHRALRDEVGEGLGAILQGLVEAGGVLADGGRQRVGAVRQRLVEHDRALRDGGLEPLDARRERGLQGFGALLHGRVKSGGPLHHDALQRREVLGRPFDHLGEASLLLAQPLEQTGHGLGHPRLRLVHLFGRLARTRDEKLGELKPALGELLVDRIGRVRDVARDLGANSLQRLADPLAVIGKRLALGGQLADQSPDPEFVLAVGPLERGDLAVHHGLELARPANGARDGVIHRRDLAPDGLSHRSDRLLRQLVGLGEPHRDLGHGRGHEAKFLGAPDQQREEPEDDDRNEDGDGGGERGGAADQARHPGRRNLRRDEPESEKAADEEPGDGGSQGHQERRARRSLLEGEDQPADRGDVVIGGGRETALRGWSRRTPRADELPRGRRGAWGWWRFGKLQGRLLGLLGRLRLGLLAFRLGALALALLGLEPLRQRGPLGKVEAPLSGWAIARLFVSLPGHCFKRVLRLIFCPCCRSSRLRLLLRHNAFLVTKRNS